MKRRVLGVLLACLSAVAGVTVISTQPASAAYIHVNEARSSRYWYQSGPYVFEQYMADRINSDAINYGADSGDCSGGAGWGIGCAGPEAAAVCVTGVFVNPFNNQLFNGPQVCDIANGPKFARSTTAGFPGVPFGAVAIHQPFKNGPLAGVQYTKAWTVTYGPL